MGILDSLNRFMSGVGCVLQGESAAEHDLRNRVYVLEERVKTKDAEIANLSEKLDAASRLASERFERIRQLESVIEDSERGPVPTVTAPRTNGGRLRAMDDYELSAWLCGFQGEGAGDWLEWLGTCERPADV